MTKKQKIYLTVASVASLAAVAILIYYFERMKQSIKGAISDSYFTIDELCHSATAKRHNIDNTPTEDVKSNLQALIDNVLDPARRKYGSYIYVHSGYRSPRVNQLVGGVANSQHLTGEAADIDGNSIANNRKIFQAIVENGVYDQLIWEKGGEWIHVSYKKNGANRKSLLSYDGTKYQRINDNWENYI